MKSFVIVVLFLFSLLLGACSSSKEEFLCLISFRFYVGDRMIEEVYFPGTDDIVEEIKRRSQDSIFALEVFREAYLNLDNLNLETLFSLANIKAHIEDKSIDAVTMVTIKVAEPSQAMPKITIQSIWENPKNKK